jgi:rhamnosyl/mannosyltransferase
VKRVNIHGTTGLSVPPADPRALAAAMNRLFNQPSWARDLGRRAKEHQANFSQTQMVRSHLDLYQSLVTRNRPLETPLS